MRRMFPVAMLSALLLIFPSAFSQRGGHAGGFGGSHAGGSVGHSFGGFSGGSFGRSSGFSARGFSTAPRMSFGTPGRGFMPAYRTPYLGSTAARRPDGRSGFRYRSPYRGYGVYSGYPYYANSWELLPWDLGYPDFTGYGDNDSESDGAQQPAESVAPPDDGYRPDYGEPAYQGYQESSTSIPDSVAAEPQLTLIFNDGHQEAIRNYVLTSDTVVVLDQAASGRQQRIPLTSLNLPATEQAAQQAGLDFSPPA
jgi:hypothetical protein